VCKSDFIFILSSLWAFFQYIICRETFRNKQRKNWPICYLRNGHFSNMLRTEWFFREYDFRFVYSSLGGYSQYIICRDRDGYREPQPINLPAPTPLVIFEYYVIDAS
jgi:hypothetical protein